MQKDNILSELIENIKDDKFIKIVFSDRQNGEFNKIIIKSLSLKNGKNIQIESFKENKAFHKNIELNNIQEIEAILKEYIENFKQILLQIEGADISFIRKNHKSCGGEYRNCDLAKMFNISESHVSSIAHRRRWNYDDTV